MVDKISDGNNNREAEEVDGLHIEGDSLLKIIIKGSIEGKRMTGRRLLD